MKKLIFSLIVILSFSGIVWAQTAGIPITVPSAPSAGYWLTSTSTGRYVASSTSPIYVGSFVATSTTATSTAAGNANIGGNLTTNITGSTQCVHADSSGMLSGTGSDCGSGGSSFAYPFSEVTDFAVNTAATTTPLFAQSGIFASSTSNLGTTTVWQPSFFKQQVDVGNGTFPASSLSQPAAFNVISTSTQNAFFNIERASSTAYAYMQFGTYNNSAGTWYFQLVPGKNTLSLNNAGYIPLTLGYSQFDTSENILDDGDGNMSINCGTIASAGALISTPCQGGNAMQFSVYDNNGSSPIVPFNIDLSPFSSYPDQVSTLNNILDDGTNGDLTTMGDITDGKGSSYMNQIVCYTTGGKLGHMTQSALLAGAGSATCSSN